jgi:hypothetical protein
LPFRPKGHIAMACSPGDLPLLPTRAASDGPLPWMVKRGSNVGGDVPNANSIGEGVADSWVVAERYVGE